MRLSVLARRLSGGLRPGERRHGHTGSPGSHFTYGWSYWLFFHSSSWSSDSPRRSRSRSSCSSHVIGSGRCSTKTLALVPPVPEYPFWRSLFCMTVVSCTTLSKSDCIDSRLACQQIQSCPRASHRAKHPSWLRPRLSTSPRIQIKAAEEIVRAIVGHWGSSSAHSIVLGSNCQSTIFPQPGPPGGDRLCGQLIRLGLRLRFLLLLNLAPGPSALAFAISATDWLCTLNTFSSKDPFLERLFGSHPETPQRGKPRPEPRLVPDLSEAAPFSFMDSAVLVKRLAMAWSAEATVSRDSGVCVPESVRAMNRSLIGDGFPGTRNSTG